jgi:hypothetical protein
MTYRIHHLLPALLVAFVAAPENAAADSLLDKALGGTIEDSINKAKAALNEVLTERIDQFLKGADDVSTDLIHKGANEGHLALVQAGNEMQIAIGVARSQFGNELDHQIGNASRALSPIVLELQRWRDAKEEIEEKAFEMEDLVAMDLGRLPLSPDYFGIRRLNGTAFLANANTSYRISVEGDNFGTEIVGQTVSVAATLNRVPLAPPLKSAPAKVYFSVPASMVTGQFKPDEIATVPFHITVTRVKDHWFWGSWWPNTTVLEHEINVSLLPDHVGDLVVETARPKFDWVVSDTAGILSQAITQDTVFTFPNLIKGPSAEPEKDDQRYGEPVPTCGAIIQNAWKLHDGEIILDSDPLIQKGWISPSWVGRPEPPDWNRFDAIAVAKFGWTPRFAYNRCSADQRCTVSPDEIKAHSEAVTVPIQECARMRMVDKNFSNNKNSLIVWIRGKADHPSLWTVTAPIETYTQVRIDNDPPKTIPVYASKFSDFIIEKPDLTVSTLHFRPKAGSEKVGILPGNISNGPQFVNMAPLGLNSIQYFYQFAYDKTLFNGQ